MICSSCSIITGTLESRADFLCRVMTRGERGAISFLYDPPTFEFGGLQNTERLETLGIEHHWKDNTIGGLGLVGIKGPYSLSTYLDNLNRTYSYPFKFYSHKICRLN